jgi:hypothetical protein
MSSVITVFGAGSKAVRFALKFVASSGEIYT